MIAVLPCLVKDVLPDGHLFWPTRRMGRPAVRLSIRSGPGGASKRRPAIPERSVGSMLRQAQVGRATAMPPARQAVVVGITLSGLLLGDAASAARAQAGWTAPHPRPPGPDLAALRATDEPVDPGTGRPCVRVTVRACQSPPDGGDTCVNARNACPFSIEVILCFNARRCGMQTVLTGGEWRWSGNGTPLISSAVP